ncbi:MAG: hypothetical protein JSS65_07650 [Armatimonadetes bacterium]|nr:hypothetical protein [Armatimonadota bacterium]
MARTSLTCGIAALSALATAAHYHVDPDVASKTAKVTLTLDQGQTSTAFHMPAWLPGDYELFHYGKKISEVSFLRDGQPVPSQHTDTDPDLWTVPSGADSVSYRVVESRGNFSPNLRIRSDEVFINGGGVFGWFDGHQRESQKLTVTNVYGPGARAATPLPMVAGKWVAKDYDHLLDSPFVFGMTVKTAQVKLGSRTVIAVGYGLATRIPADMSAFAKTGAMAAEQTLKLVGDLPWQEYRFYFDFGGGGGGLEHLEATRIGTGTSDPRQMAGIIFHEFFHCVNVKTVRAQPLGPFDYTKAAKTSTLWWLEGVTDYYADVLAMRAGLSTPEQTLQGLFNSCDSLNRSTGAQKVTASEASLKVWDVRGSFGYGGLSYYSKGAVVGHALDWAIRAESQGKHSLDDVVRQLYKECHGGPGYKDTRIRELVVQYGGPKLGPLYDSWVDGLAMVDCRLEAGAFGVELDGTIGRGQTPSEAAMLRSWSQGVAYSGSR